MLIIVEISTGRSPSLKVNKDKNLMSRFSFLFYSLFPCDFTSNPNMESALLKLPFNLDVNYSKNNKILLIPWSLVDIFLASKLFAKLYYMNLVRMDLNRQPWIMKHLKWTVNVACAIKFVIKEES